MLFGCIWAAFGYVGIAFGHVGITFGCIGVAFGCIGVAFCCICNILQDIMHIAGWLAGHRDPRIQGTCPVEGNMPLQGAHYCILQTDGCMQNTTYRIQDTGYT